MRTFDALHHIYTVTQFTPDSLGCRLLPSSLNKREEPLLEIWEKRGLLFIHFLDSNLEKGGTFSVREAVSSHGDLSNIYLETNLHQFNFVFLIFESVNSYQPFYLFPPKNFYLVQI